MDKYQELLAYYCGQLRSDWVRKKALAYLRILAEAEGDVREPGKGSNKAAVRAGSLPPRPALRSES